MLDKRRLAAQPDDKKEELFIQRYEDLLAWARATLTLSKSDLHPIEQTLIVERGGELREYRFVEASFERLPTKDVAPAVFEVEPELLGGAGGAGRPEGLTGNSPRTLSLLLLLTRRRPVLPLSWKSMSPTH